MIKVAILTYGHEGKFVSSNFATATVLSDHAKLEFPPNERCSSPSPDIVPLVTRTKGGFLARKFVRADNTVDLFAILE